MDAAALCLKALQKHAGGVAPQGFLPQFQQHLDLYPHDTEWLLQVEPGTYGVGESFEALQSGRDSC